MARFATKIQKLEDRTSGEHRDCTVHALAFATGMKYVDAHSVLAAAGRETGKGFLTSIVMQRLSVLTKGQWFAAPAQGWSAGHTTVNQFCRLHPTGSYVLRIKGHAFAVVNGRAVDTHARVARERVQGAWEVYPALLACKAG